MYRATLTLTDPRRFRVQLVDREGRSNKLNAEIVANVTRNHPAVVKMTQPAHDVQVSPVEELKLKAELDDDFGLVRHGVSFSMAGREPARDRAQGARAGGQPPSARRAPARLRVAPGRARPARHLFLLGRGHRARRPDAADLGRHVLRRGPAFRGDLPPGRAAAGAARPRTKQQEGQEDNARSADQLAELQKEIINGTWKLIRRETRDQTVRQARRGRQGARRVAAIGDRKSGGSLAGGCRTRRPRPAWSRRRAS